ncbi:hypothetical protein [Nostoc favosum]|uniref:Uncharacterized protein n=1 Tax=Nostoc favosum CHAB5714 TaxID=2780399 RepID=A0ABS8I871_9NOSO|nr:hypothetical protein [Nostoc favosum]MCC5600004.1 hypothetical protein [Nostoc favosum CHAB5714]
MEIAQLSLEVNHINGMPDCAFALQPFGHPTAGVGAAIAVGTGSTIMILASTTWICIISSFSVWFQNNQIAYSNPKSFVKISLYSLCVSLASAVPCGKPLCIYAIKNYFSQKIPDFFKKSGI